MKIKIFLDGANQAAILEHAKQSAVSGFTTNPTLMRRAGITDYKKFATDLLAQVQDKPISFEVFADEFSEMERQANEIASWGENVYVKIPVTNTKGHSALELIETLSNRGVKLNVTALLTVGQTLEVCEALSPSTPALVSVFAGRIADTGVDPMPIMRACAEITKARGPKIELLWASSREVLNIYQAEEVGCDVITVTADLLKKMSLRGESLEALSLSTVCMFHADASEAGFRL